MPSALLAPPAPPRRIRSWRTQLSALQLALVGALLAVTTGAALRVVHTTVEEDTEQRALAVARTVAADPRYLTWMTSGEPSPDGPVQQAAEAVRVRTQALYVVVADADGIRYSHPDPAEVGRRVSTDPSAPLAGRDDAGVDEGRLGWSARGKVAILDAAGRPAGLVSVGFPIAEVDRLQRGWSQILVVVGAGAFVASLAGVLLLRRQLRRATHGLEPEQLADVLREHAALLDGASDGIVAIDAEGRVRLCNAAAHALLGAPVRTGVAVAGSGLPAPVLALVADPADDDRMPRTSRLVSAEGRVLDVRRLPVRRDGADLGSVLVLTDRTDLDDLGRELEATRALTDALRAQTHEHANRLHTVAGLLDLGHADDARAYVGELAQGVGAFADVDDPYLAGLLAAKSATASEQGVQLRVDAETWVPGRLDRPLDSVTVVGNLVDNAIRAARTGNRRPAWVDVLLLTHDGDLHVAVRDSGDGVAAGNEDAVFDTGWTSRPDPAGHGLGLSLARATARRHGGDITLESRGGPGEGASFGAVLRGVARHPDRSPRTPVETS